jgi:2-dehydropantoate 2-reductase
VITVFGAGAIGLVLAARLARAGNAVRVCTRSPDDAQQIAQHGIDVEEPGTGARWNAQAIAQAGPPVGERDAIFACVRGPDARAAASQLFAASPDAPIVNVQNGLDGDAVFAERFARVIGAVIRHNCTRVDAHFARSQQEARIIVGAYPRGAGDDVETIAALLRDAGYDTGVSTRIAEDRWLKLCVNLMSTPNALVRPADHETRAFTEGKARLLEEAREVLAAAGIAARSCDGRDRPLEEEIEFQRGALGRGVAARKLPLYNSLWQGLARGAALEVDAYHRRVVELGAQHGIETPVNARVLGGLERVVREKLESESLGAAELLGDFA